MIRLAVFLLSLILLSISGCSGPRSLVIEEGGSYIEGVPFFPQDAYMCGPAALASVLGYWGASVRMDDVVEGVYNEKLKGTLAVDIMIYAKGQGFDARYYRGSLEDLKEKIGEGKPLILFLNLGLKTFPQGHYIVVVGFSEKQEAVLAHSGKNREEVMSYRRLLKAWEKADFSTVLITPRGR